MKSVKRKMASRKERWDEKVVVERSGCSETNGMQDEWNG